MAKKPKLLSELFHDTLKDVYFAENRILKTLPKMAKAAHSKELKAAFVKHEKETRGQVKRLEQVFKIFGKKPQAKKCEAIMGITKEGAEIMADYKGMPALDAGLAAAAQAVEHYEMSRYGTLKTWAQELGMPEAAALLDATLKSREGRRQCRSRGRTLGPGRQHEAATPMASSARVAPPYGSVATNMMDSLNLLSQTMPNSP
jgi:ferritin-like metal-binding protein YciE